MFKPMVRLLKKSGLRKVLFQELNGRYLKLHIKMGHNVQFIPEKMSVKE